jgi:hypothetical protein
MTITMKGEKSIPFQGGTIRLIGLRMGSLTWYTVRVKILPWPGDIQDITDLMKTATVSASRRSTRILKRKVILAHHLIL